MSEETAVDPHPDDVLSMAIRQRDAARAERDKLQRACITLGWVVEGMARSLRAAWIDIRQGDLKGAAQWVLESVPGVDDAPAELQWDGAETSQAWFDRTRPEPLSARTAPPAETLKGEAERSERLAERLADAEYQTTRWVADAASWEGRAYALRHALDDAATVLDDIAAEDHNGYCGQRARGALKAARAALEAAPAATH